MTTLRNDPTISPKSAAETTVNSDIGRCGPLLADQSGILVEQHARACAHAARRAAVLVEIAHRRHIMTAAIGDLIRPIRSRDCGDVVEGSVDGIMRLLQQI